MPDLFAPSGGDPNPNPLAYAQAKTGLSPEAHWTGQTVVGRVAYPVGETDALAQTKILTFSRGGFFRLPGRLLFSRFLANPKTLFDEKPSRP